MNDDGWHTPFAAGVDVTSLFMIVTQLVVSSLRDSFLFLRLSCVVTVVVTLLVITEETDLYVSPEAMEDIRNWGVDQVDEVTRRNLYRC